MNRAFRYILLAVSATADKCGNECGHIGSIGFLIHGSKRYTAGLAIEDGHTQRHILSGLILHGSHRNRFDISSKAGIFESILLKAFRKACSNTGFRALVCRHRTSHILRLILRNSCRHGIRIGNNPCTKRCILLKSFRSNNSSFVLIQNRHGHGHICTIFRNCLTGNPFATHKASAEGLCFSGSIWECFSRNSIL